MTVDDMYNIVLFATGKNHEQGYISSDDFNTIIPVGMRSYMAYLLGNFQQYGQSATAKVELGRNSTIRQRLRPAITKIILNIDTDGLANYPNNFLQYDAIFTRDNKKIKYVEEDRLAWKLKSVISPIDDNPIFTLDTNFIQFYPKNIGSATLSYILNPPDIKWGYILDGNGREVYNAGTSVQPLFDDLAILEIIVRALQIIGVNLTLPMVSQYAKEIKVGGQ